MLGRHRLYSQPPISRGLRLSASTAEYVRFALLTPASDADPYIPGGNGAQWYTNQNNLQVACLDALSMIFIIFNVAQLPLSEELRH
jgi:hypothetical protein